MTWASRTTPSRSSLAYDVQPLAAPLVAAISKRGRGQCRVGLNPHTLRVASRSLAEAANDLRLQAAALVTVLESERWVQRRRSGTLVASARHLTVGHLNQVRRRWEDRPRVDAEFGPIRITPNGMLALRQLIAQPSEVRS